MATKATTHKTIGNLSEGARIKGSNKRRLPTISKKIAREVIEAMPNSAAVDDIMYALYVAAKFEQGDREIQQGHGVPQELAIKRLNKWLK